MIVQADFADGDDFWVFGVFAQSRAQVGRRFHGFGRVPADGGINRREFFRQPDGAFAAAEAGPDGNHFGDAGGLRAGDDFRQVIRVIGIIKMRVGIVKRRHANLSVIWSAPRIWLLHQACSVSAPGPKAFGK